MPPGAGSVVAALAVATLACPPDNCGSQSAVRAYFCETARGECSVAGRVVERRDARSSSA